MTDQSIIRLFARPPEWLRRKERGSAFGIRLMVGIALYAGRRAVRLLLPPICLYYLLFSNASRRASQRYLTRALGRYAGLADIFRHYFTFGSCVIDRIFLLKNRTELFDIRVFGEEILSEYLGDRSGCVMIGAHMGSFEVLRSLGRRRPDLKVNMVMFEENARKVNSVLNAIDPELAKDIIGLGRPDSFITIQRCLDQGHFVGLLADRSLTEDRHATQNFLGAPAQFPVDPFRMITLLQKPAVLMFGLYRGGNIYEVHFERFPTEGAKPDEVVGRYVARLEHYCRHAPYNWFNFFDIWS